MANQSIYLHISEENTISTLILLLSNKINAKIQDITWHLLSLGKENETHEKARFIFENVETKILDSLNELKSTLSSLKSGGNVLEEQDTGEILTEKDN